MIEQLIWPPWIQAIAGLLGISLRRPRSLGCLLYPGGFLAACLVAWGISRLI